MHLTYLKRVSQRKCDLNVEEKENVLIKRQEEQLRKRRIRDGTEIEAETEEQRMARLQRKHARESDRLAAETPYQREALLDRLRVTLLES